MQMYEQCLCRASHLFKFLSATPRKQREISRLLAAKRSARTPCLQRTDTLTAASKLMQVRYPLLTCPAGVFRAARLALTAVVLQVHVCGLSLSRALQASIGFWLCLMCALPCCLALAAEDGELIHAVMFIEAQATFRLAVLCKAQLSTVQIRFGLECTVCVLQLSACRP